MIDPAIAADFEAIRSLDDGDFRIVSRDVDDRQWIVEFQGADRSTRYFLWDRTARKAGFQFSDRPELDQLQLAAVRPIKYRARDGMEVLGYLAIPAGLEPRNLPLVVYVHGGPWLRDYWDAQPVDAASRQSRLRGASAELSRFDGIRDEASPRRRSAVGSRDAGRPDRCGGVGG